MEEILRQIRSAKLAELYYVALMGALTVPDMCAAAETPHEANGVRYARWFEANMPSAYHERRPWPRVLMERHPEYATIEPPRFSGHDAWKFRCALLHEGSGHLTRPHEPRQRRVWFLYPGATGLTSHLTHQESGVSIDLDTYVDDTLAAATRWLAAVGKQPHVEANLDARFVRVYPDGLAPYAVGIPVIA